MKTITNVNDKLAKLGQYTADKFKQKDKEALLKLLRTENGRWFILRLLDKSKLNAEVFTGNSQTFYNEGKRSIGLQLLGEIAELGLNAVKLKQKGELEYVKFQVDTRQEYYDGLKEGDE